MPLKTTAVPGAQPALDFRLGHRPGLDGIRGIAVLLVLGGHLDRLPHTYANIGVDLFFVLSGFLITCLLVEEWRETRDIRLRSFYARRALRLLPCLAGVLASVICYAAIFDGATEFRGQLREAAIALVYFTNWSLAYHLAYIDLLGPTWTLSIEEQFYLIWPALLLLLLRRTSVRTLLYVLLAGTVASWLARVALQAWAHSDVARLSFGLDTRADSLLIGCAAGAALSFGLLTPHRRFLAGLRHAAVASVLALLVIGATLPWVHPIMIQLGWFLVSLLSAVVILHVATSPGSVLLQILQNGILRWLGRLSYGLYLWHYPVMRALMRQENVWHVSPPDVLFVTLICVLLSYYLLEQPCLRLKKRFQRAGETKLPVSGIEPVPARA